LYCPLSPYIVVSPTPLYLIILGQELFSFNIKISYKRAEFVIFNMLEGEVTGGDDLYLKGLEDILLDFVSIKAASFLRVYGCLSECLL
jgi:hypothetical protein